MRYHYEKKREKDWPRYAKAYRCDHPVYNVCTLYLDGGYGLAVIRQRYDPKTKRTWWCELEPELADDLYLQPGFHEVFDAWCRKPVSGLYPTVTVRQLMWVLKMKPLKKESWETVFDHKPI